MSTKLQKKAVGYVRISTESQQNNSSQDTQKAAITEHCDSSGMECLRIFTDIGSGADLNDRPQYKAMLKFIKGRKDVDALVAMRLDRLARNTITILQLVDFLAALKPLPVALELTDFPIDCHTPIGRLIITILAAVAELERHMIAIRTTAGRLAKDAAGGYAFGAPAFGWIARAGELLPDVVEQEIMQYLRRWNRAGWSLRDMAAKLTALKMPTKRGGKWHPSIVSKILKRLNIR